MAGESNLNGKVLVDISNALDYSRGMPPTLTVANTDSLAEQIQRAAPSVKVVKTLNTVNAAVMVDPRRLAGGDHDMFVCGNDLEAKAQVTAILKDGFGWKTVIDLGDITAARGMEMCIILWARLLGVLGSPAYNIRVVR
jgi:predicted dinucleotide-binding enzyme